MDAVVFVGPSLDPHQAASVLPVELPPVELLPPVRQGDVARVAARAEPPACVGIVDGVFLHDLSISPKEILRAMDHGIRFFGSSSMGALRAVELEPFGMVGVGRIFSLFRSGEIEADDEVAVTYDPETLRALSKPIVNIRIAVAAAVERGLVSPARGSGACGWRRTSTSTSRTAPLPPAARARRRDRPRGARAAGAVLRRAGAGRQARGRLRAAGADAAGAGRGGRRRLRRLRSRPRPRRPRTARPRTAMSGSLTGRQVALFHDRGFHFPVEVMAEEEAGAFLAAFRRYERVLRTAGGVLGMHKHFPKIHLVATWADRLVHDERILDAVESVVGPDILAWSTGIFTRPAGSAATLAWHQDVLYFGLRNVDRGAVRVWVALTPTSAENGTMRSPPPRTGAVWSSTATAGAGWRT